VQEQGVTEENQRLLQVTSKLYHIMFEVAVCFADIGEIVARH
jgi:hypothetical protein